ETDVIAPDRVPVAVLVKLVAQRARFVRRGEGVFRRKPEIANAAALGEQHHRPRAAGRKADVADRLTETGARNVVLLAEEVRQDELAPHVAGEIAVGTEPHRPDRVALVVILRVLPARIVEGGAAPDRVIEPHFIARRVAVHADTPDPPAGEGDVPALRCLV